MKLWTGKLSGSLDESFTKLNHSLPVDQRLALEDIKGSIAWAKALHQAEILNKEELTAILNGLTTIREELYEGSFQFVESDEDIHTAVERRLTEIIGECGRKIHTGRSRNDQVATDFRLWVIQACNSIIDQIVQLQRTFIQRAEVDFGIILPGYTHLQQAQPILLSHWWMSFFWAFQRDTERFLHVIDQTKVMPLGSGALAGTSFPIDRFALAKDLGFTIPSPNSLDAVSDRDFAVEFAFSTTLAGIHLSRIAESIILYSSSEFGFFSLSDKFSTGSSLMPQKKNPDSQELIRGKSAVLIGKLTGLLAMLKALPSAYDKDLQEDKLPVFEAYDILSLCLEVMRGCVATLDVHPNKIMDRLLKFTLSTDVADYLVKKGVPFRTAHNAVAMAVKRAEELGLSLERLPLNEWQLIHSSFGDDIYDVFSFEKSLDHHSAWGGTSPEQVKQQILHAKSFLPQ